MSRVSHLLCRLRCGQAHKQRGHVDVNARFCQVPRAPSLSFPLHCCLRRAHRPRVLLVRSSQGRGNHASSTSLARPAAALVLSCPFSQFPDTRAKFAPRQMDGCNRRASRTCSVPRQGQHQVAPRLPDCPTSRAALGPAWRCISASATFLLATCAAICDGSECHRAVKCD